MTGKAYDGLPRYEPIKDCMGNEVKDEGYDFQLNTYKNAFHTQSRTAINEWLMMLEKENWVEINTTDGGRLGIRTGDLVRLTSPSNGGGITGQAKLVESRPGVISISHSYGHWEYGAKPQEIDGKRTAHADWIGKGVSANPVMRLDPVLKDVTLQDPIGGSASFYDTKVKVEKV